MEYLRSFGLFGLWQLWQSSGPGGRAHFMIAEKSSDVKVKRVSRLAESKSRCCISHNFGGFYQIIPCIRPAVVRIKVAHGCPATIRIFILGRAVQAWQGELSRAALGRGVCERDGWRNALLQLAAGLQLELPAAQAGPPRCLRHSKRHPPSRSLGWAIGASSFVAPHAPRPPLDGLRACRPIR